VQGRRGRHNRPKHYVAGPDVDARSAPLRLFSVAAWIPGSPPFASLHAPPEDDEETAAPLAGTLAISSDSHEVVIPETAAKPRLSGTHWPDRRQARPDPDIDARSAPLKLFCIPAWIPGLRFAPPGMTKRGGCRSQSQTLLAAAQQARLPRRRRNCREPALTISESQTRNSSSSGRSTSEANAKNPGIHAGPSMTAAAVQNHRTRSSRSGGKIHRKFPLNPLFPLTPHIFSHPIFPHPQTPPA